MEEEEDSPDARRPTTRTESKKTIQDYTFYIGSNKQASDFNTTSKFMINHIRKTYTNGDDIADALESETAQDPNSWMPTQRFSSIRDATAKDRENKQYEKVFEAELEAWIKRKEIYRSNLGRAYALLFERCNKAMQLKITARKDFEGTIKKDPIELLKAIKEHSVSYQETKYPLSSVYDAIRNLVNIRQRDDESLIDYSRRFKTASDILKSQLGSDLIIDKVAEEFAKQDTRV